MKKLFIFTFVLFSFLNQLDAQNEKMVKIRIQKAEYEDLFVPQELKGKKTFIQKVVEGKGKIVKGEYTIISNFSLPKKAFVSAKYEGEKIIIVEKRVEYYSSAIIAMIFIIIVITIYSRMVYKNSNDKMTFIMILIVEMIGLIIFYYKMGVFLFGALMIIPLIVMSTIKLFTFKLNK